MSTKAFLGEVPLLGSADVRWPLSVGTDYAESTFDVRPSDANTLLAGDLAPVSLTMDDDRGRQLEIKNLYVLARVPADNPNMASVLVVDRRWFWSFTHVRRSFNIRRNVGVKRQRAPNTPPELQDVTDEVAYAPWSLKSGQPWTAREALESILGQLVAVEGQTLGNIAPWEIDQTIGDKIDNVPLEDVEVDDEGHNALKAILNYLPEAEVMVDTTGKIVVFSRATLADQQMLADAGAESVGGGHVELIANHRLRPRKIHVLFTRECEVRFDFIEQVGRTVTEDERYMDNVLPIPDYQLDVGGDTMVQGTWISFEQAFRAWGAPPRQEQLGSPSGWYRFARQAMVPYMDMWSAIGQHGLKLPDVDWMSRLGAIQEHFRRTFRINRRWMDRIRQLKAHKVATLDPTTGQRAPALAYADHARLASQRSILRDTAEGVDVVFAMNVQSYPTGGGETPDLDATARAAPATVSIADHDQGIIQLQFLPDIYRFHEMLLPSAVELEGAGGGPGNRPRDAGPTSNIEDIDRPISFNAVDENHGIPQLTADHKAAVVLTAVPAGNNDFEAQHLARVTLEPTDVADLVPNAFQNGLTNASGPEMEIRIGPTIETARIAWVDSRRLDIEALFGVIDRGARVDDLTINLSGTIQGGGSLEDIARAVAARTWAMLADRMQGSKTVRLSPQTVPIGHIRNVTHEVVAETGAVQTVIELPEQLRPINFFSLLPESTRRVVLRLAPSPGKGAG